MGRPEENPWIEHDGYSVAEILSKELLDATAPQRGREDNEIELP